ncbi:MAG: hypothetical protein GY731_12165, partial [Gammaproteobacteria bacterium]|nr:hypothetical protein [Gammaproteobacteria bacterium]
ISSIQLKVADAAANDGPVATQAYTLDTTAPIVSGSATTGGATGSDTSVTFRVTFSGSVDNIDTTDFTLTATGSASGNIASVSAASGDTVDVTVDTIAGAGSLRLDVAGGHDLTDTAGNIISGGYTGGTPHLVDFTPPTTTISGIDISADTGTDGDFVTKTAAQTITATLSTGLVGGEVLNGSVNGGTTWTDITAKVTGTAISWDGATLAGSSSIQFKVTDAAANDGDVATQAYTLDTSAPTTTVSGIDISADTGSSDSDFETKTASQTITGTLSTGLAGGETLQGSVDGGTTWTDVTGKVSGTAISWDGATLSGTDSIQFKVTDAADNDGAVATQAYTLDTTVPTVT